MGLNIRRQIRSGLPKVGRGPYNQIHAHSTGNSRSTAQNEADNQCNNRPTAFFTHVVGNGQIIQIAEVGRGAYDVGGGYNYRTYAAVELIESHKDANAFWTDYKLYIDLLRQLCAQAGVSPTLDSGDRGVLTHDYCRRTQPNNGTSHVDPYPYLAKWGVDINRFRSDLANGYGTATTPSKPAATPAPSKPASGNPNVKYQAYANGKWWGDVVNYNNANSNGYAGVTGRPITGLRFNSVGSKATAGNLQGRAHVIGAGWQAWVTDRADYIGLYGKPMDMVQFNLINLAGKQINYRVHVLGGNWLPWVRGFNHANSNGYAGIPNKQIDMIQMYIS